MRLRHFLLPLLIALVFSESSFAQETEDHATNPMNNTVFLTPGLQGLTLSYERTLWHSINQRAFFKTFAARFEAGPFRPAIAVINTNEEDFYPLYALSVSALSGKGNNHLEIGLGIVHTVNAEQLYCCLDGQYDFYPNIGYRFQRPEGRFFYRAGISHPRYTYFSVGYAF